MVLINYQFKIPVIMHHNNQLFSYIDKSSDSEQQLLYGVQIIENLFNLTMN